VKPYFDDGQCVIYHGDCREILPELGRFDLLLTDPPYGINAARKRDSQRWGWRDYEVNGWDAERPADAVIAAIVAAADHAIIWGGNYFVRALPFVPAAKWLIWDKGQTDFSLADCEMAWCSWEGAIRRLFLARATALRDGREHPTEKPLTLMAWCIQQAPAAAFICDPFMGSGTTLRAAKDLGRKAIGIEIEERYCEIAAKRLNQQVLPLFAPEATA